HSLTAVYGGDANDAVSTSPAVTQTVNPAATSTGLTSSPNPSTFGQSVALTATVSPSAATGTVTFKDGSTSLGTGTLSNGTATLTLSTLATGPHSLTAVYGGDATDAASTSPALSHADNAALPSFPTRRSSDLSTFGQSVALTATVSPSAATGTVTFKDGSTSLGTGTLSNGTATLTLSTLATGPHSLTAVYGGD